MPGIAAGIVTALIFAAGTALLFRWKEQRRYVQSLLKTGITCAPLYIPIYAFLTGNGGASVADFLNGLVIYGALFYYLSLVIVILQSSLTVTILTFFAQSPRGSMTFESIRSQYPFEVVFRKRTDKLTRSSYLTEKDGTFANTPKGERLASLAIILKKFFNCFPGG